MNRVMNGVLAVTLMTLLFGTTLFAGASGEIDSFPLANYIGAINGRKIVYSVLYNKKLNSTIKNIKKIKIECQSVDLKKDSIEIMFGRTDMDEPIYLNVFKNEIHDASIGGVIIKKDSKPGDTWKNYGKKNNRLLSQIEVLSFQESKIIAGIIYSNCITLLINDYRAQITEERTYAYGVGLIQEIQYEDTNGHKPIITKTIISYSDK